MIRLVPIGVLSGFLTPGTFGRARSVTLENMGDSVPPRRVEPRPGLGAGRRMSDNIRTAQSARGFTPYHWGCTSG